MANLAIAALLVALILAGVFLAPEPFEVLAGNPVAILNQDDKTCSVEIHEDEDSKELDVKCGPTTSALHAEGIFQRSGVSLLDNGRLRRADHDNDNDRTCTLLMSDDLVQYNGKHYCDNDNPNLYENHSDTVEKIERNGPFCRIKFKPARDTEPRQQTNERVKEYLNFLSRNAANIVVSRPYN